MAGSAHPEFFCSHVFMKNSRPRLFLSRRERLLSIFTLKPKTQLCACLPLVG